MQQLVINQSDGTSTAYELSLSTVTIGSGMDCVIIVPDESVAPMHIQITLDVSGYVVSDLAGNESTSVNDYPIEPGTAYQMESGMRIRMGTVEVLYLIEEEAAAVDEAVAEVQDADSHATYAVTESFPIPGSFPMPRHADGAFAPAKSGVNLWLAACILTTLLSVGFAVMAAVHVAGVFQDMQ
jgi:predicted component of type VI protein secretion system